ncbi:hypothetical protein [Streptomyces mirabilis]|uniref:hypothetical protein n=1 Tax=Streptomyces mirabilis TaxID=68239 RepID=UPI0036B18D7B
MSIHARCFVVSQTPEGRDVACQRSKGHDADKPKRERLHRTHDDGGWVWLGDAIATREEEATPVAPAARWTLGHEGAGSDDAAWVLRHGTGADTVVYETNSDLDEDDHEAAQGWGVLMLGKRHDVAVTGWTAHRPGPGTSPDYWAAEGVTE